MDRSVVVTSISGAQQSAVAQTFRDAGWRVLGVERAPRESTGILVQAADLLTGEGLRQAFEGAQVVAFTTPQDHRSGSMTTMARNVVAAAAEARVQRLVVNLAGTVRGDRGGALADELEGVRKAVQSGSVPWTILSPTIYMDNLRAPWILPAIIGDGVLAYPVPASAPVSWISHRSLAQYVEAAASQESTVGEEIRIGGPEALTVDDLARILTDRIGRSVRYQAVPIDQFAAGLNQAMGAPTGDRVAEIYQQLEDDPEALSIDAGASPNLSLQPETFAAFVERLDWR